MSDVPPSPGAATRALQAAGIVGFWGVLLGAFGAHALKERFAGMPGSAAWWETAVHYHQIHALLLLVLALWRRQAHQRVLVYAGRAALLGVVLFSGSLYAMALTGVRALGAITPLGGLCFLFAWGAVVFAAGHATGPAPAQPD